MSVLIWFVVVATAVTVWMLCYRRAEHVRRKRLLARAVQSMETPSGDEVQNQALTIVMEAAASTLRLPANSLRPSDDLLRDLAYPRPYAIFLLNDTENELHERVRDELDRLGYAGWIPTHGGTTLGDAAADIAGFMKASRLTSDDPKCRHTPNSSSGSSA